MSKSWVIFHGGSLAVKDRVLDLVRAVLERDVSDAELEILIRERGIDGDDVRKAAHGDTVLVRQLLAIELFSCGALAKGLEAKDPEIVGAESTDEAVDVGVESVDGGGDQDHGRDADGNAENGQAGAQFVFAQGVERQPDGFSGIGEYAWLYLRSQSCDGVKLCSLMCWINTEEDSDGGGNKQADEDGPDLDSRREGNDERNNFGSAYSREDADEPAYK